MVFLRILLAVVLLGAVCLAGCSRRTPPVKNTSVKAGPEKPAAQDSLKVELRNGRIVWDDEKGNRILEAKYKKASASQTGGDSVVELLGVKASLYKNGKVVSSLTAPRVTANSKTKEVKASGGVKLISAGRDASTNSDQLIWKSREDKVFGKGAVKMVRVNISITASSFEADAALNKARFKNAVMSLN